MRFYFTIYLFTFCLHSCDSQTLPEAMPLRASIDMDTVAVKRYAAALERKLLVTPTNSLLLKERSKVNNYLLACSYYEGGGWSWAVKGTGMNYTKRLYLAADMLKEMAADTLHPLYYKSLYLRARIYYWLDKEDGGLYPDTISPDYFTLLSTAFPEHQVLKMYRGENIFFATTGITNPKGMPGWAVYQREAVTRMLQIIHWWVNERQAANGELGGKYGDDVEILRWWMPAILGADDSVAIAGHTRLADGVWNSGILEKGFAKRIDDVEHSAELFRDTHAGIFLVKYGDPEYVERCMIGMQHFNEVWTGITPLGHRHFKSYYLSATQVKEEAPYGVDVPLNARALLPGLWTAWYNRNPAILTSFAEWCAAWSADADREENGKPRGVFPAAVTFASDKIGGYKGNWYDADLAYSYYRWESLGHISELYSHFLGMYAITKDSLYLEPIHSVARLMDTTGSNPSEKQMPGSLQWVKNKLTIKKEEGFLANHPMGRVFSMAKKISGNKTYDPYVLQYGDAYNRYETGKDKNILMRGLDSLLPSLRYNFPLFTSEVKFTDRVYIPGSNLLLGMYTGHFGAGYEYPALVATWKNTGKDVAVLVRQGNDTSATVSLYNSGKARQVTMRTWMLEPGVYKMTEGIDRNDDGRADEIIKKTGIQLSERVSDLPIVTPAEKNYVVSLVRLSSILKKETELADPGLSAKDITVTSSRANGHSFMKIQARIHNIGNTSAENLMVYLIVDGVKTDSSLIGNIQAPNDLRPRSESVLFTAKATGRQHRVGIRIEYQQPEITRFNNYAERIITINSR